MTRPHRLLLELRVQRVAQQAVQPVQGLQQRPLHAVQALAWALQQQLAAQAVAATTLGLPRRRSSRLA